MYGRFDQLLWNLFHGERWRSSIPIVKWPIRTLWMIQDTQRPLKLLYRSSIDWLPESQSGPQKVKKSLEVPLCWLLIWSREPPRDWRFQWLCCAEDLHVSVVPICLIIFDLRTSSHILYIGYPGEGNGFCPLSTIFWEDQHAQSYSSSLQKHLSNLGNGM